MKNCTFLLFISLFLAFKIVQANGSTSTEPDEPVAGDVNVGEKTEESKSVDDSVDPAMTDLTDWYVNAANGDDKTGTGSVDNPFKSIRAVLSVNKKFPGFVGEGDAVYLEAGTYDQPILIDIPGLRIEGFLNEHDMPESILGNVKITADKVSLANCLFLNSRLTLLDTEAVSISNNLFSGTVKSSLILLGSSESKISDNRFESAVESCVVIRCSPKSKRSSGNNVFQRNYFTHHPEDVTRQVVLINQSSFFKDLFGKRCLSYKNRFIQCTFKETIPGQLKNVVTDHSTWQVVAENGYSLRFEDCYFKKADRDTPFISFMIIGEYPNQKWYWDELINDTWFSLNHDDVLTGNKKSEFIPFIQFADWDEDGLILETKTSEDLKAAEDLKASDVLSSQVPNSAPDVVSPIADIAVYENATPDTINLFDVFDDDATVDENLEFTVNVDKASLIGCETNNGQLTLNYSKGATGVALITVTATDNDSSDPKSSQDSFHVIVVESAEKVDPDRNNWYVDSKKGDDVEGVGSISKPFKSIDRVFALYAEQPELKGTDGTIYLSEGDFGANLLEIKIAGLEVKGTLDKYGKPLTTLGEVRIAADGVKLENCKIVDAPLTLLNVENVLVSNNVFFGNTDISLYLLGASNNKIQHNEFSSAIHDCVHIFWDSNSKKSSNSNVFWRNYFTHRSNGTTNRIIRVKWLIGNNNSISVRNHFVECAFKETESNRLLRVVDDDANWWVVADHKYSVMFEDCYFKRADRRNPFSEFVILKGHPDFKWRWDELINDEWVSSNASWAITGDHNGWKHKPRIQFVDRNGNGKALEMVYNAGLLSVIDN